MLQTAIATHFPEAPYRPHLTDVKTQLSSTATFLGHKKVSAWARPRPWGGPTRASIAFFSSLTQFSP